VDLKARYMGSEREAMIGDVVIGPGSAPSRAIVIAVNGTFVKILGIGTNPDGETFVLPHPSMRAHRWIHDCPAGECHYLEKQTLSL
jgi:hypothetical protein